MCKEGISELVGMMTAYFRFVRQRPSGSVLDIAGTYQSFRQCPCICGDYVTKNRSRTTSSSHGIWGAVYADRFPIVSGICNNDEVIGRKMKWKLSGNTRAGCTGRSRRIFVVKEEAP